MIEIFDRSEYEDQAAVFEWADLNANKWPCLKCLYGSLMGVKLSFKHLNKVKKSGMRKGKPDINLPVPIGGYVGLWIELKRRGGDKPTSDQVNHLTWLGLMGNAVYSCRGSDTAIMLLENYLCGEIVRKGIDLKSFPSWDPTLPLSPVEK